MKATTLHSVREYTHHRRTPRVVVAAALASAVGFSVHPLETFGQAFTFISTDLDYVENFDSMAETGSFVPGWTAIRGAGSGTVGATLGLGTTDGSTGTGGIYSIGTTLPEDTGDRAFGSIASGSTIPWFGASFLNNTGLSIGTITFGGFMEQWRTGQNALTETLAFEYSFDATSLNTGSWTPLSTFELVEKLTSATTSASVNGNLDENRTAIAGSANMAWANNTSLWIRWKDADNTGTDGMYAIDNFSLVVATTTPPKTLIWNPPGGTWNTTDTNWLEGNTARAFSNGDNVSFTDSGLSSGSTVNVVASGITPGNITVSNSTGTYTFVGGPISGTGQLTKSGAGTLILAASYANSVTIDGGTLKTASSNLLGDTATISVRNGAVLDLSNNNDQVGPVQLQGGTVTTGTGTLTLSGDISTLASDSTATINGILDTGSAERTITTEDGAATTDLVINAKIIGTQRLNFAGVGTAQINADNSGYTGNFRIQSSTVVLNHPKALGDAQLFLNGGNISAGSALVGTNAIPNTVSIGGNATLSGSATEWAGEWTFAFAGAQTRKLFVENETSIKGAINGSDDILRVGGSGTFKVSDVMLQAIEIEGATVLVSGSLSASVATVETGTLGGTGTVTNTLTVGDTAGDDDAFLAPGTNGIGTLTVGSLSFLADAAFKLELNSTLGTADKVVVSDFGSISLETDIFTENAALVSIEITDLGNKALPIGTTFTIFDNLGSSPISGSFIGASETTQFVVGANRFEFDYTGGDGNDLVLRVVPEPGSVALLAVGAACLGLRRRRNRV